MGEINQMGKTHPIEERFFYSYSAQQKKDVEAIRQKYLPKKDDKMVQLRHLDQQVTLTSTIEAIFVGMIGALLFGIGMCCIFMGEGQTFFVMGIITGIIGMIVMGLAYPVYRVVLKRKQAKIAPEILKLSDEILNRS